MSPQARPSDDRVQHHADAAEADHQAHDHLGRVEILAVEVSNFRVGKSQCGRVATVCMPHRRLAEGLRVSVRLMNWVFAKRFVAGVRFDHGSLALGNRVTRAFARLSRAWAPSLYIVSSRPLQKRDV